MEQGRTPTFLVHLDQLARQAAALVRDGYRGGLVVRARLDRRRYPIGKKVSAKELSELNLERDDFHGDWNYVIRPRKQKLR